MQKEYTLEFTQDEIEIFYECLTEGHIRFKEEIFLVMNCVKKDDDYQEQLVKNITIVSKMMGAIEMLIRKFDNKAFVAMCERIEFKQNDR